MEIVVNIWAVLAAAVSYMVIGTLWYGPLFGKQWMALSGLTLEGMKVMALKPWQAMIGGFITAFFFAFVLAHVAVMFAAVDVMGALQLGFWMWLGFVVTTQAAPFLWEGKPFRLWVIHGSMSFVATLVMALIIVLFR